MSKDLNKGFEWSVLAEGHSGAVTSIRDSITPTLECPVGGRG